jgi:hypothetical protein
MKNYLMLVLVATVCSVFACDPKKPARVNPDGTTDEPSAVDQAETALAVPDTTTAVIIADSVQTQ